MKFESKSNDSFSSVLFSFQIPFVKRTIRFHVMLYTAPDTWVTGYTSKTKNGLHCLFFDFDDLCLEILEEEIRYLQKKFKLSDFYVWRMDRPNAWHAVCLDVHSLQETFEILQSSSADQSFISAIKYLPYREWTLRLGPKGERAMPKFFKVFPSSNYSHTRSSGHAALIKKLGVQIRNKDKSKWDKYREPTIVTYNTANRTRKE